MLVAILGFSRTAEACQKKFEIVFKSYKEDKLANSVLGNDKYECKFYDSLDQWWHLAGSVMKHVSAQQWTLQTVMHKTIVMIQIKIYLRIHK